MDLAYNGDSILDAALKVGADLPFACKGGVCCTCRAKVVEGAVDMEVNYALEKDEVEKGYVLTCQSHPRTERVVIDFDAR
jgi:ring-1,2-phenylacetyl-CoA epoxidase subunit PaaE